MLEKYIFILITVFCFNIISSQEDNYEIYYKISVIDRPQTVELYKLYNGTYNGNIKTELIKGKWYSTWLGKTWRDIWNIKSKDIVINSAIDNKTVEYLISELKNNNIETLKEKCIKNNNCEKISFLDYDVVYFEIKTKEKERNYSFAEIYPIKENYVEKLALRKQAQNLITILYNAIDLNNEYKIMFNKLPKGYYYYYTGNGVIQQKRR